VSPSIWICHALVSRLRIDYVGQYRLCPGGGRREVEAEAEDSVPTFVKGLKNGFPGVTDAVVGKFNLTDFVH